MTALKFVSACATAAMAALAASTVLVTSAGAQEAPAPASPDAAAPKEKAPTHKVVFVIAFENHDSKQIYGNSEDAPYINKTLLPAYAHATNFGDLLPKKPSEPHYVWMEAGTNQFSDHTFVADGDPTQTNSTGSTAHLVTQIRDANNGSSWMSYQQGINNETGKCPIRSDHFYAAKHNPFVFFRDVVGSPPSKTNAYCIAHHKDYTLLAADLVNSTVATYNFISPNLCNDMHGAVGCPILNQIKSGDTWLKNNLPPIIDYVNTHNGVIFLVWDEGSSTKLMPFIAIGPHVKAGYTSTVRYDHSALLKSVEKIVQVPILPTVASANDFTDLFQSGKFP